MAHKVKVVEVTVESDWAEPPNQTGGLAVTNTDEKSIECLPGFKVPGHCSFGGEYYLKTVSQLFDIGCFIILFRSIDDDFYQFHIVYDYDIVYIRYDLSRHWYNIMQKPAVG